MNKYYVILSIQLMLIAGTTIYADPDMGIDTEEIRELAINFEKYLEQAVKNLQANPPEEIDKECVLSPAYKFLKKSLPKEAVDKIRDDCIQRMRTYTNNKVECYVDCFTTRTFEPFPSCHKCTDLCNKNYDKEKDQFWKKALKEKYLSKD